MSIFSLSEIRHLFQTTGIPEVKVGTEGLPRKGDLENKHSVLGYVLLAKFITITNLACSTILMNTNDEYLKD